MSTRTYVKWTQKEKNLLKQLVKHQNAHSRKFDWSEIADAIETKTSRQCYDQYILLFKTNDKSEVRHSWTEDEEQTLVQSFQQNPYKWTLIQKDHFPALGIRQLKNKYNQLAKLQNKDENSSSDEEPSSENANKMLQTQGLQKNQNLNKEIVQNTSNGIENEKELCPKNSEEINCQKSNQIHSEQKSTENTQNQGQFGDLAKLLSQLLEF
ncbi:Conserved_hypothetical protein [Hexamita inflata]|uniref:Myb-like DNA-binding domain-containing protein n=1 Tax=Hexamita inflata TaxID=28002 RepID=A0AA86NWC5_9EUKA|nr:Conserved hypothetical protein [Hexamita inflata]